MSSHHIRAVQFFIATSTALSAASIWADEVVPVASLDVKERIRTIDQINVSAETDKVAEAPSTAAVAALLEEAEQLDANEAQPKPE